MKKIYFLYLFIAVSFCNSSQAQQDKYSHTILFKTGKHNLSDHEKARLDSVIGQMKKWGKVQISLSGHTDDVGTEETNDKLSMDRVTTVYNYLALHKFDTSTMETLSYGEANPIADNEDTVKKILNRSVEMSIQRSDSKRTIKVTDCFEMDVPERAYAKSYNDDIDFKVNYINTTPLMVKAEFPGVDDKGNAFTSNGMLAIGAYLKKKDVTKDRKLPITVRMCGTEKPDTFWMFCSKLVKGKMVWSKNSVKAERVMRDGKYWYTYTIPPGCDSVNGNKPCRCGDDLCKCLDPFVIKNLSTDAGVKLYTTGTFMSPRGVLVNIADTESLVPLQIMDIYTPEEKCIIHAYDNLEVNATKDYLVMNIKPKKKDKASFTGKLYITRPISEDPDKYKLYYLNSNDSLNPIWDFVGNPTETGYKSNTCKTYTIDIAKSGIYMFVASTMPFDHSIKVKVKKMTQPSIWVLYKDKKKNAPGQFYHTSDEGKIPTIQMMGDEKNSALIVYAYRKGQLYFAAKQFSEIKYKKRKGYYLLKKKDFKPYGKNEAKDIPRLAKRYN